MVADVIYTPDMMIDFVLVGNEGLAFGAACPGHGAYYCKHCIIASRPLDFGDMKTEFATLHIERPSSEPKKVKQGSKVEEPRSRFNSEGDWDSVSVTEFNRAPLNTSEDDQD